MEHHAKSSCRSRNNGMCTAKPRFREASCSKLFTSLDFFAWFRQVTRLMKRLGHGILALACAPFLKKVNQTFQVVAFSLGSGGARKLPCPNPKPKPLGLSVESCFRELRNGTLHHMWCNVP